MMKNNNKIMRCSTVSKSPWHHELDEFLSSYRITPHSGDTKSPAELMFGRIINSKIPHINLDDLCQQRNIALKKDKEYKEKAKLLADHKTRTQKRQFKIGDKVLIKQQPTSKLQPLYNPHPYTVIDINHSMITAKNNHHQLT